MSLILAVEPDADQTELLERIVAELRDVEFMRVSSAREAADAMVSQVPDLVLLGRSLDRKAREHVVDHFILASDVPEPQMLDIPPLRRPATTTIDSRGRRRTRKAEADAAIAETLSAQITNALSRVDQGRREQSQPAIEEDEEEETILNDQIDAIGEDLAQADAEARLASEIERVRQEAAEEHASEIARLQFEAEARLHDEVERASRAAAEEARAAALADLTTADEAAVAAELQELRDAMARAQSDADARLASELERVRRETAEQQASELARLRSESEGRFAEELERARMSAGDEARNAMAKDLADSRGNAEQALAAELARVHAETDQRLAEQAQRAEARLNEQMSAAHEQAEQLRQTHAALEQQLGTLRAEFDARLETELAQARKERDEALQAQQQGHLKANTARESAARDARSAVEAAGKLALEAEVERVRGESEKRLQQEVARMQADMEQTRQALLQAQVEAEAAREAANRERHVAADAASAIERARSEGDGRLLQETTRLNAEIDQVRRALQQAQVEAEAVRQAAAREIQAAADSVAKAERARTESEGRLQHEVERLRADVEQSQQALQRAQVDADAQRVATAREMQAAIDTAAARTRDAEIARADVERQLRTELDQLRQQADRSREAHLADIEKVRADVERDTRTRAEATMRAEVARARLDADARLASEVARVLALATQRDTAELAEIRAQQGVTENAAVTTESQPEAPIANRAAARADTPAPSIAATRLVESEPSDEFDVDDTASESRSSTAARIAGLVIRRSAAIALVIIKLALVWSGKAIMAAIAVLRGAVPIVRRAIGALPPRALAAVSVVVVAAAVVAVVGLPKLTSSGGDIAKSTSRKAVTMLGGAARAVQANLKSGDPKKLVGPMPAPSADVPVSAASEPSALSTSPGMLAVFSRVPMDLYVSGNRIGTTDDSRITLPPGRYRVGLVSTRLGYRGEVTIDVKPGGVTSHNVALPNGSLRVDTEPGAEVWIEGERAGVAPLDAVQVPIGTREVVIYHPELGERRLAVEVRFGDVTEMRVPLRREGPAGAPANPLASLATPDR